MNKYKLRLLIKRVYLFGLSRIFRFDPWHSKIFFENSGYMEDVASISNGTDTGMAIELGCGLGEQLMRINKPIRLGIDINKTVIKGARFKNNEKHVFYRADVLNENELNALTKQLSASYITTPAVFIMVNWIHAVELAEIRRMIKTLQSHFNIKYVLVDLINEESAGYKYKYTAADFADIGQVRLMKNAKDGIRKLLLLRPGSL